MISEDINLIKKLAELPICFTSDKKLKDVLCKNFIKHTQKHPKIPKNV